ncbi:hypothetical protein MES5069_190037 [Mesorhizobium escarrei]|uniref:Uncharacterized protein n=1 Tax=Mesorhizobium escarrei TaxID=666018 RepID=A0ABN8JM24_9HYPH|nr:hypothetical protein MES5069_190037 [Mesorhizobium escarrei]
MRSEHASAVTEPMRAEMAARLIEEHGSPHMASDAGWALARENGWYREGEAAERYLTARPSAAERPVNKAALDLLVAWHRNSLGRLIDDGSEWRWKLVRRSAARSTDCTRQAAGLHRVAPPRRMARASAASAGRTRSAATWQTLHVKYRGRRAPS